MSETQDSGLPPSGQVQDDGQNDQIDDNQNNAGDGGETDEGEAMDVDEFLQVNLDAFEALEKKPALTEGHNYRLISGKRKDSKLVVFNKYTYLLEKTEIIANKVVFYLKCRHKTCRARATIRDKTLQMKDDRDGHTCSANQGQSSDAIRAEELATVMKRRAAREGSTYHVSLAKDSGSRGSVTSVFIE